LAVATLLTYTRPSPIWKSLNFKNHSLYLPAVIIDELFGNKNQQTVELKNKFKRTWNTAVSLSI
jgi:hypothetical protein